MNNNVRELGSHPEFGLSSRIDVLAEYDPIQIVEFWTIANMAYDVSEGLKQNSVAYDSCLQKVLADFPDKTITYDDCWKLTETKKSSPLIDIRTGQTIEIFKYYLGYVLTNNGEILEYEKPVDDPTDINLIHAVDRHKGIYVINDQLSSRCYKDENIMNSLDVLSYKAGLRTFDET